MHVRRDLVISVDQIDCERSLSVWRWIVPPRHAALLIGIFGDWVFGAPDGSLWLLCLQTGCYLSIAPNAEAFNAAKQDERNLNAWFKADWAALAQDRGLAPLTHECLGWKNPPIMGGATSAENIDVFPLLFYQSAQSKLHRALHERRN